MAFITRARRGPRELVLFVVATLVLGIAYSLVDSTYNNLLNEKFPLTGYQRSFLELPRELPGFLVVFVSALLWFLCSRRLAAVSLVLGAAGSFLIGFASPSYANMVIWLFILSMGQHLYMPLAPTIGMELARVGKTGQRLGQLNAVRNLATILGSFLVVLGFKYLGFTFRLTYAIAAGGLMVAALLMFSMTPEKTQPPKMYLQLHREYRLYYILNVISGARKQLFLTFAPWVLVKIFGQPTQIMATLYTIGGMVGVLFQPFLGWAVDHLGERIVLASEAVILVFVCFGYGFARFLLPEGTALLVVFVCFLLDQMIFSVGMARSTYMKKIALQADDIQPALTAAVTIDHVFSIAAALIGGVIWNAFGFQYVFLLGVLIALINFIVALQVQLPKIKTSPYIEDKSCPRI
jgi:predicted MFS family arabinose efflux permease